MYVILFCLSLASGYTVPNKAILGLLNKGSRVPP